MNTYIVFDRDKQALAHTQKLAGRYQDVTIDATPEPETDTLIDVLAQVSTGDMIGLIALGILTFFLLAVQS